MLVIADGLPRGLGYLEIDNRAAGAGHHEYETYTCRHCEFVVVMNPQRTRERYKCKGCNHHICDECAAKRVAGGPCRTMAQVIDESLERESRRIPDSPIILP